MKRNNRLLSRCAAGLLALTLALSLIPAAAAAERTVTLSTREELLDFAARCASDTYSKGLTVYLADDIDLGGTAVSVPIFLGTFEGGGHRIRGLALKGSASSYGLFSQVEAGGPGPPGGGRGGPRRQPELRGRYRRREPRHH